MAKYKLTHTGAQIDAATEFGYNPDNAPTHNSDKGAKSGGILDTITSAIQSATQSITALIPTALSQLGDDATHRLVTDTEKSTWNGKQNALSFVSTPSSSNKVLTQSEMGEYKRITNGAATQTLNPNTLYDYGTLTAANFTLGTPTTSGSNEWQVGFVVGSGFALTVTPPSGYTLKWKDGTPTFTAGTYCELSFLQHTTYVVGIMAETALS